MIIEIRKCDLCKEEFRSDSKRHWSVDVANIHLNMKGHIGIQTEWKLMVCTDCGLNIRDTIEECLNKLKKKDKE